LGIFHGVVCAAERGIGLEKTSMINASFEDLCRAVKKNTGCNSRRGSCSAITPRILAASHPRSEHLAPLCWRRRLIAFAAVDSQLA
jgi:hypothetical protein